MGSLNGSEIVSPTETTVYGMSCSAGSTTVDCGSKTVTVAAVIWTEYCTGPNDPNGNNWQIWKYDNSTPINYQFVRSGDPTCQPATTVIDGQCGPADGGVFTSAPNTGL